MDNIKKTFSSPGLRPFVTIFHWDTPLALEEKYGGFLSEKIMYGCASCQIIDNHN